ncbi:MAG: PLP-dependent aminotransferase family protein, partial [bacterium]
MTNTLQTQETTMDSQTQLCRESGTSLVNQIVRSVETRIEDKLLRTGARMPSIRQYADTSEVSRFTVVEA